MDKAGHQRQTHDFMNVQSFSQLPFIRRPPREKAAIRLFGIEFNAHDAETIDSASEDAVAKDNGSSGESGRKFECHYCCRNFPTSQALGGHQNAHKRERLQAKRAQVHSSYQLLSSRPPMAYPAAPPWNDVGGGGGSHGSLIHPHAAPINGNPLGFLRIPAAQSPSSHSHFNCSHPFPTAWPLLADAGAASGELGGLMPPQFASSQNRYYAYCSNPSMNDHVSLDLRL